MFTVTVLDNQSLHYTIQINADNARDMHVHTLSEHQEIELCRNKSSHAHVEVSRNIEIYK
jgi:hypothetical protein